MVRASKLLTSRHPPQRKPHVGITVLVSLGMFAGLACLLLLVAFVRNSLRSNAPSLATVFHRSKQDKQLQPAMELGGATAGWPHILTADRPVHEYIHGDCPTRACHAATLVHTRSGGLVAAWFGGTAEKDPDVGIWLARKLPGQPWQAPFMVAKVNNEPHWNPVLFYDQPDEVLHGHQQPQAGRMWMHFKVGPSPRLWRTYAASSQDDFVTWASPAELVPGDLGGRGCVKNKPLVMQDGTILAGLIPGTVGGLGVRRTPLRWSTTTQGWMLSGCLMGPWCWRTIL
ncbi:hypothetical protein WJX72_001081 [[Myrmecia] bisecta]|uniref:Sialidase domain-containing protein n=1 Tax=[Myrmecia] bisecta TaxID=41462 RepID=A0AAW1Q0Z3_9CHLO